VKFPNFIAWTSKSCWTRLSSDKRLIIINLIYCFRSTVHVHSYSYNNKQKHLNYIIIYTLDQGWGASLLLQATWSIIAGRLQNFILKFYLYLTIRGTSRDFLSTWSSWSFVLTQCCLYSNLGNKNYDAGHIKCSSGPDLAPRLQAPHPYIRQFCLFFNVSDVFLDAWQILFVFQRFRCF